MKVLFDKIIMNGKIIKNCRSIIVAEKQQTDEYGLCLYFIYFKKFLILVYSYKSKCLLDHW
jgi:hypothetical protein